MGGFGVEGGDVDGRRTRWDVIKRDVNVLHREEIN